MPGRDLLALDPPKGSARVLPRGCVSDLRGSRQIVDVRRLGQKRIDPVQGAGQAGDGVGGLAEALAGGAVLPVPLQNYRVVSDLAL
jgi:hypothetical protein